MAFRVLSASVNMLLGALREQQQLRKGCFAGKLFIFRLLRKRHEKRAVGHSLLHKLIALASMVRTATLNMQLEALRDQQQLWENCFLKMFVRRRLWKDATPLKRRKQPNVRSRRAYLGSNRGCHGAGWCRSVRAPWSPARQSARKEAELVKWAGAPTRRQMHQVGRWPPRRGSM